MKICLSRLIDMIITNIKYVLKLRLEWMFIYRSIYMIIFKWIYNRAPLNNINAIQIEFHQEPKNWKSQFKQERQQGKQGQSKPTNQINKQ